MGINTRYPKRLFFPQMQLLLQINNLKCKIFHYQTCFYKYKLSLFNIFFNKPGFWEYHCISPTVIWGKKTVPAVINSNWWKTHADCIVHLRAFCDASPFLHFHAIWPWPFLAAVTLCQSAHNQCLSPSVWSQKTVDPPWQGLHWQPCLPAFGPLDLPLILWYGHIFPH